MTKDKPGTNKKPTPKPPAPNRKLDDKVEKTK